MQKYKEIEKSAPPKGSLCIEGIEFFIQYRR